MDSAAGLTTTKMKVGFMTYDSKINFYYCNAALAQPQQMTVRPGFRLDYLPLKGWFT